jgi:hypothetical protein
VEVALREYFEQRELDGKAKSVDSDYRHAHAAAKAGSARFDALPDRL